MKLRNILAGVSVILVEWLLTPSPALAEEDFFLDAHVPIVHHQVAAGAVFPQRSSNSPFQLEFIYVPAAGGAGEEPGERTIGRCAKDAVRRVGVQAAAAEANAFDILFFDGGSRYDRLRADASGSTALAVHSGNVEADELAASIGVSCLPTRVLVRTEGGARYIEFREGRAAAGR